MGSRYVGQLGRYAGQLPKSLAHIQTYEVAMQASQALIHRRSRSLCVHPSRYIPSGARASGSALPLLGSPLWVTPRQLNSAHHRSTRGGNWDWSRGAGGTNGKA